MQTKQKELVVVRLRPDMYSDLERKCKTLAINENTTPLQAGYALGVESVLKLLRVGYTIESDNVPQS